ncbi:HK97 gp10 family phage protein [Bacillus sp. CGMCC 1.16607]|uniref:HK97 gp10 family phage protein n=1 Tax=Bacillus sp. CGMCC 1.16607 TaxID=3351842 RepID=UPI0036452A78
MGVKIDNLANEITKQLELYTDFVKEEVEKAQDEISNETVKELREKSPERTGDYRKGWRRKKTKNGYVIHNATNYRLTHLLEHGHAKASGGRVPAKVHIRPIEEKKTKDFLDRVERAIKQ